jgi:hypothetical protein
MRSTSSGNNGSSPIASYVRSAQRDRIDQRLAVGELVLDHEDRGPPDYRVYKRRRRFPFIAVAYPL